MTLRLTPVDQLEPEDLDAIADLVVSDPQGSWGLAGSREHIEALCRRYQELVQERDAARWADETRAKACEAAIAQRDAAHATIAALERDLARVTNRLDEAQQEIADLRVRDAHHEAARTRLSDLASDLLDDQGALRTEVDRLRTNCAYIAGVKLQVESDLATARKAIADREDEIAKVNNERQAEVNEAANQRERADTAESIAEIFEATAKAVLAILDRTRKDPERRITLSEVACAVDGRVARELARERQVTARLARQVESMAMLLDEHQATHAANDRIRSAFASAVPAICDGVTVEELDDKLDEELAAHLDAGPLHHARDQRDHQEDTTP